MLKSSYFHKRWRKVKSELLSAWLLKYKMCVSRLKKCLTLKDVADTQRKKSHAKLHPVPGGSSAELRLRECRVQR